MPTENQTQAAPDAIRAALCTADDRLGIPCFFLSREGTCNQLPSEDACRCRPALARLAKLEAVIAEARPAVKLARLDKSPDYPAMFDLVAGLADALSRLDT